MNNLEYDKIIKLAEKQLKQRERMKIYMKKYYDKNKNDEDFKEYNRQKSKKVYEKYREQINEKYYIKKMGEDLYKLMQINV